MNRAPTDAEALITRLDAEIDRLSYALEVAREAAAHWQVLYHRAKDELATAAILSERRSVA